jgi:hypothetical protein
MYAGFRDYDHAYRRAIEDNGNHKAGRGATRKRRPLLISLGYQPWLRLQSRPGLPWRAV